MPPDDPSPTAPLPIEALCWRCDPAELPFESTEELEDLTEVIGQDRALEAIRFAVGMERPGYNLYALGPEGTGRHTAVRLILEEHAAKAPRPPDWCYISNFKERRSPRALRLEAGRGRAFQSDMARFVDDLRDALRAAFEGEEHRTRRQVIEEAFKERQEKALAEVEKEAAEHGIALLRTPMGMVFAPLKGEEEVLSPEEFKQLAEEEQAQANRILAAKAQTISAKDRSKPCPFGRSPSPSPRCHFPVMYVR